MWRKGREERGTVRIEKYHESLTSFSIKSAVYSLLPQKWSVTHRVIPVQIAIQLAESVAL